MDKGFSPKLYFEIMKSPIELPNEVVTPTIEPSLTRISCEKIDKAMILQKGLFLESDSETDQTASSTVTYSSSEDYDNESVDSVSDCDEDDFRSSPTVDRGDAVDSKDHAVTSNETDTISSSALERRSVSFGPIHVRQYERIVGDHPNTRVGVPLSIGWGYYEDENYPDGVSIERYEADRIRKGKIRMSSITRKNMLLNVFKLPENEILQAEKRSKKLLKERERKMARSESTLKSFGRKLRKGSVSLLKGISHAQLGSSRVGGLTSAVESMF